MIDFDFLADLPTPEDDEPASLRSDIEDELADHLQCAMRREILKDGNETAAETRVLDRFGDPKKLAYRLWWQAMWSRIMGKRILSGLQWILTLAAVVLAGTVLWQQSSLIMELRTAREADTQKFEAIAEVMKELKTRTTAVAAVPAAQIGNESDSEVGGLDGTLAPKLDPLFLEEQPATKSVPNEESQSVTVTLVGEDEKEIDLSEARAWMTLDNSVIEPRIERGAILMPNENEKRVARQICFVLSQPNRYQLHIEMGASNQSCIIPILVGSDEQRQLIVVCPNPSEKAIVHLTAPPLPNELQAGCELNVILTDSTQKVNGIEWRSKSAQYHLAKFGGKGGAITALTDGSGETINLRQAARQDRAIVLLAGAVQYSYEIKLLAGSNVISTIAWPENGLSLSHSFSPGENNWEIKLPEEFLNKARNQFLGTPYPPPASSPSAAADTSVQRATADDDPAVLNIKLVEGAVDGPPVLGAQALLSGENVQMVQFEDSQPFTWVETKRGIRLRDAGHPVKGNVFRFTGLKPNRYTFQIWLNNDDTFKQSVLIRDDKPQELTIVCPPERSSDNSPVLMTVGALPQDLQQAGYRIWCKLSPVPFKSGSSTWHLTKTKSVVTDFNGNGDLEFVDDEFFPPETPTEDRVAFLPQQTFLTSFTITKEMFARARHSRTSHEVNWFELPREVSVRTVNPGENRWSLKLSEEMIAAARKELANTETTALSPVPQPSVKQKISAEEIPLGDKSRWIVELKSELENGLAQTNAAISLYDEHNNRVALRPNGIVDLRPDNEGRCILGPINPGRYSLLVTLPEDRRLRYKLPLVRPGQERIEKVVCPKPATRSTALITASPVPEELRINGIEFGADLTSEEITLNGKTWSRLPDERLRLQFDAITGLVNRINELDLRSVAAEDRAALIRTGAYRLTLGLNRTNKAGEIDDDGGQKVDVRQLAFWPTSEAERKGELQFVAEAGDNKWDIKVPEEFWANARAKLAEISKE